jgi:hypothetical protein
MYGRFSTSSKSKKKKISFYFFFIFPSQIHCDLYTLDCFVKSTLAGNPGSPSDPHVLEVLTDLKNLFALELIARKFSGEFLAGKIISPPTVEFSEVIILFYLKKFFN